MSSRSCPILVNFAQGLAALGDRRVVDVLLTDSLSVAVCCGLCQHVIDCKQ